MCMNNVNLTDAVIQERASRVYADRNGGVGEAMYGSKFSAR